MTETPFEREVLDRLIKIESKLDGYGDLKKQVYENKDNISNLQDDTETLQKSVGEIQDNNKWMWRTVVGAIIVALVGVVIGLL